MVRDQEKRLGAKLKLRNPTAWAAVYDRHVREIFGLVFHLVGGDHAVAEELNQEIWLTSIDRIDQFDPSRGSVRGWLFAIARQQVALHFRRHAARGLTSAERREDGQPFEVPDSSILPDDLMEQTERADAVRAALSLLAEDRREVLILKYVDRLSVGQIAARTAKTTKAVESLLSRARAQMRDLLRWYFAVPAEREQKERCDGGPRKR